MQSQICWLRGFEPCALDFQHVGKPLGQRPLFVISGTKNIKSISVKKNNRCTYTREAKVKNGQSTVHMSVRAQWTGRAVLALLVMCLGLADVKG